MYRVLHRRRVPPVSTVPAGRLIRTIAKGATCQAIPRQPGIGAPVAVPAAPGRWPPGSRWRLCCCRSRRWWTRTDLSPRGAARSGPNRPRRSDVTSPTSTIRPRHGSPPRPRPRPSPGLDRSTDDRPHTRLPPSRPARRPDRRVGSGRCHRHAISRRRPRRTSGHRCRPAVRLPSPPGHHPRPHRPQTTIRCRVTRRPAGAPPHLLP